MNLQGIEIRHPRANELSATRQLAEEVMGGSITACWRSLRTRFNNATHAFYLARGWREEDIFRHEKLELAMPSLCKSVAAAATTADGHAQA